MSPKLPLIGLLLSLAGLAAGCSSGPKASHHRGWVGGEFMPVRADYGWLITGEGPAMFRNALVGLPDDSGVEAGLLVTDAGDDTPLAGAGIRRGDLLLRLDGEGVGDPLEFRESIEDLVPGSTSTLAFWREGETHETEIGVGTETFQNWGRLGIGLALSSTIDIWPFDDGIDILSLLQLKWDDDRVDLHGPESGYLQSAYPDEHASVPMQEQFTFRLIVIGVSKGKRVQSQEAAPAE